MSNKSVVLGDGGRVATECSSTWEVELESDLLGLESANKNIMDLQIVKIVNR